MYSLIQNYPIQDKMNRRYDTELKKSNSTNVGNQYRFNGVVINEEMDCLWCCANCIWKRNLLNVKCAKFANGNISKCGIHLQGWRKDESFKQHIVVVHSEKRGHFIILFRSWHYCVRPIGVNGFAVFYTRRQFLRTRKSEKVIKMQKTLVCLSVQD